MKEREGDREREREGRRGRKSRSVKVRQAVAVVGWEGESETHSDVSVFVNDIFRSILSASVRQPVCLRELYWR